NGAAMHGRQPVVETMRSKVALGLVAAALLLRLLVPSGWMPIAGNGYAITLCTGMGTVAAWVDADGTVHKEKPASSSKADSGCIFSGFSTAFDTPKLTGPLILPVLAA